MTKRVDRHRRRDGNHKLLASQMLGVGYSVLDTADLGHGAPDFVVGANGINLLLEVKNPEQPPSKRRLTQDEQDFCNDWRGQYDVVETIDDVIRIVAQKLKEQLNGKV